MVSKSNFGAFFSRYVFPMRYNSESCEIKVVISGNGLLFKDIKISLELLLLHKNDCYITTSRCQ